MNKLFSVTMLFLLGCATSTKYDGGPIDAAIRMHRDEFRMCYERKVNLTHDEHISGKVVIILTIEPDGESHDVRVFESTMTNARVEQCIAETMKKVKFPPVEKATEIKYPFVYSQA